MSKHVKPNFLSCPGVPELGPGSSNSGARRKGQGARGKAQGAAEEKPVNRFSVEPEHIGKGRVSQRTSRQHANPPTRQHTRPHYVRWAFITFILVIGIALAPAVVALTRAGIAAQASKSAIDRMVTAMGDRDIDTARAELNTAHDAIVDARRAMRGVGFWRDVPGIGTQLRALEDAASAGAETLEAVGPMLDVASDVLDIASESQALTGGLDVDLSGYGSFNDIPKEEKRRILARLDRAIPDMRIAQAKIDVALETWNRIPQHRLVAPLRNALQPIAEGLPRLKRAMDEAIPLLEVLIPVAGYPELSHYVVVLQNTDEIRATGGFIGTVGRLDVDSGEINEETFRFVDVYALDNPATERGWSATPPGPIAERLGVPAWYFRDANWSPDFPTSAQTMMDFYVRESELVTGVRPPEPTGLIALNPPVFEELLRITGPVTVNDGFEDVTFEAGSFFDTLEYQVEVAFHKKGIPVERRKDIVQLAGNALLQKAMDLPASKLPDLLDVLTELLEREQVMIYATDPSLQARLDAFDWTGRVPATEGDYLSVIDSNLAALKTDDVVEKEVSYSLDADDPSGPLATVTLTYTNNAPGLAPINDPVNFKYTRYRSYTRVYVPEGAELVSSSGAMRDDRYRTGGVFAPGSVDVYRDLGKTVFGAFWSIEPQTTQTLSFTYRLPFSIRDQIADSKYVLDWQKQSGNDTAALTLDLLFGKNIESAVPGEPEEEWGDGSYRNGFTSLYDRRIEIEF